MSYHSIPLLSESNLRAFTIYPREWPRELLTNGSTPHFDYSNNPTGENRTENTVWESAGAIVNRLYSWALARLFFHPEHSLPLQAVAYTIDRMERRLRESKKNRQTAKNSSKSKAGKGNNAKTRGTHCIKPIRTVDTVGATTTSDATDTPIVSAIIIFHIIIVNASNAITATQGSGGAGGCRGGQKNVRQYIHRWHGDQTQAHQIVILQTIVEERTNRTSSNAYLHGI